MNRSARDVWFFSRDGQQSGPLTYRDLKEKADEGVLRPRTDLIWKEGMAEWRPIGEIEGLFERQPLVKPEAAAEPYKAAPVAVALPDGTVDASVAGPWLGVRRRGYLAATILLPALHWAVVTFLPSFATGLTQPWAKSVIGQAPLALAGISLLVILVVTLQRFANLAMSRWWIVGMPIFPLNIWLGYRLFSCPAGYAVHKKMDGPGIFLAIIYWLAILLYVVAIAVIAATLMGSLGSPEQQEQLKKIIEQLNEQARAGAAAAGK